MRAPRRRNRQWRHAPSRAKPSNRETCRFWERASFFRSSRSIPLRTHLLAVTKPLAEDTPLTTSSDNHSLHDSLRRSRYPCTVHAHQTPIGGGHTPHDLRHNTTLSRTGGGHTPHGLRRSLYPDRRRTHPSRPQTLPPSVQPDLGGGHTPHDLTVKKTHTSGLR